MSVEIGTVTTWDTGCAPREQVEKMASEVMEVFAEVQAMDKASLALGPEVTEYSAGVMAEHESAVAAECADVITATCNLLSMLGVTDFTDMMRECAERQRERGRL